MEVSEEINAKALACETVDDLLGLAAENEIELTAEEADFILRVAHEAFEGELADAELDNVSGGDGCEPADVYEVVYWKTEAEVQFLFEEGAIVEAYPTLDKHHTATCKVVSRRCCKLNEGRWRDDYWLEKEPGSRTPFIKGWIDRGQIQK